MEKEQEKEMLNPERELTMEDLVCFREMCRLENIITRFRDQKSWRPSPDEGEGPADGDRLALLLFANGYLDDPQAAV